MSFFNLENFLSCKSSVTLWPISQTSSGSLSPLYSVYLSVWVGSSQVYKERKQHKIVKNRD